jgi:hypothetical protein
MKIRLFKNALPCLVLAVLLPVLALSLTTVEVGAGCCGGPPAETELFRVYVSPNGGGDVTIDGKLPGSYPFVRLLEKGGNIHLEATPADGYYFVGWSGSLNSDENPTEVTLDAEMTITAQFFPEEIVSADSKLHIAFRDGTVVEDKNGTRLCGIELAVADATPPPPPDAEIIGEAYELGPHGATFTWPATLSFSYDPDEIPAGIAEKDLILGYYDEDAGEWLVLSSGVDEFRHTLSTRVNHLSTFAVMAPVAPIAPVASPAVPAAFTTSALNISPLEADVGETVTVSVLVTNTGEEEGSYSLALKLNGTVIETQQVTMAGGSQEVVFSLIGGDAGSYTVAVDGLEGSFTVVGESSSSLSSPSSPSSSHFVLPGAVMWTLLGLAIAALVLGAIIAPIISLSRRYYDDDYY